MNAHVPLLAVLRHYLPSSASLDQLCTAINAGALAGHQAARVLRVAWALADLADHDEPSGGDIAAALALYGSATQAH